METKDILKQLRKSRGYSNAKDFCDASGISYNTYQNYEAGKRVPTADILITLADFYGVTTDYLLGREPLENPVAGLNITVDNKKFIDIYQELPELQQQLLVDAMKKLGASAEKGRAIIAEKQKLGTIEDDNTENEDAHQDAG
jgi:transcriptional regulator with XRE-family HTH domain